MSHEASRLAWLTKEPQHGARLVLLALADHHNATTNRCCPSVARLVETTRLERKAVIRGIAELERLGVIGTERKNGCHSQYNLHFLDQSQNGTGDKMGPVTKEDSTSPKMGRDRSQNGTRNRERTGKEPGKVLIGEPEERQPDASEAASATNTPPAKKNPATVPSKLRPRPDKVTYQDRGRWSDELRNTETQISELKLLAPYHRKPDHQEQIAKLELRKAELQRWLDGGPNQ
jgi:hypothetical protein